MTFDTCYERYVNLWPSSTPDSPLPERIGTVSLAGCPVLTCCNKCSRGMEVEVMQPSFQNERFDYLGMHIIVTL